MLAFHRRVVSDCRSREMILLKKMNSPAISNCQDTGHLYIIFWTPPIFVTVRREGSTNQRNVICLEFLGKKSRERKSFERDREITTNFGCRPSCRTLTLESLEYTPSKHNTYFVTPHVLGTWYMILSW